MPLVMAMLAAQAAQPRQHDQHQHQKRLAAAAFELAAQDHAATRRMVAPSEDSSLFDVLVAAIKVVDAIDGGIAMAIKPARISMPMPRRSVAITAPLRRS